jgi:colanic acid biosynthesis glycosyl transferase WcaI
MCEWLVRRGHSVHVICPPPYYPWWKVQAPYKAWVWRSEVIDGVTVSRCPIWVPLASSGLQRLIYAISFVISSFPVLLKQAFQRPDVMLVIEPSFLNALATLLVAKCSGALAWLHVQDFEIDLAFDLRQFRSRPLRSIVGAFERWVMRRFDIVSTISSRMLERVREKGVSEERSVLFPNWVDTKVIYPIEGPSSVKIVALYSGTTGVKQGLEILIDAAKMIQDRPDIVIVICGDGTDRLQALANGLDNVRFLPLQPLERVNDLLNTADIHLLPQKASVADLVMPSKLLGMVASGRPVIATAEQGTEVARVVAECGIVVAPEDARALADAIVSLAGDRKRRQRLGRKARAFAVRACEKDAIIGAFERELLSRVEQASACLPVFRLPYKSKRV